MSRIRDIKAQNVLTTSISGENLSRGLPLWDVLLEAASHSDTATLLTTFCCCNTTLSTAVLEAAPQHLQAFSILWFIINNTWSTQLFVFSLKTQVTSCHPPPPRHFSLSCLNSPRPIALQQFFLFSRLHKDIIRITGGRSKDNM